MAQLIVRNLEESLKRRLQQRARLHGRSMEAEVRDILRASVARSAQAPAALGSRIASRFRGQGLDAPIEDLRDWSLRIPGFGE